MILLPSILIYNQVDNSITTEDIEYIRLFLRDTNVITGSESRSYEEEIDIITMVQSAVLSIASGNIGIPYGAQREPKNVYSAKSGLCYDRSRVIEKILRYLHFQTRHISIYSTEKTHGSLLSLITPGVSSHAVTEVLTSKGWVVVDSNDSWISLDGQRNPISIKRIQSDVDSGSISWSKPIPNGIYKKPFTFVYGLYSRHGRFYPPYNFIPDINYKELMPNVL